MFKRKGVIVFKKEGLSEDAVMELVLEAGAEDVADEGDSWMVTCEPAAFTDVREALAKKVTAEVAEIQSVPSSYVEIRGKEAEQIMRLVEMLEELDEVLNVFVNCDFVEQ